MSSRSLFAVAMALLAALFFAVTFVFNRDLVTGGGHWEWAIILRYLITFPLLGLTLPFKGGLGELPQSMRAHPCPWIVWSGVAFVLFGIPLTWAAESGPSWLVAGSFQATVLAGPLMAPLIYHDERARLAWPTLTVGSLIVLGVFTLQWGVADGHIRKDDWLAAGAVLFAAFMYPLGNRKLLLHLEHTRFRLGAVQRVFGMTLCTLPVWIVFAIWAWIAIGPPTRSEWLLGGGVALCSGTIATVLFYAATDITRREPAALAAVESMQAGELLFSTAMGVLLLGESWPTGWAAAGVGAIVLGIALSAWVGSRNARAHPSSHTATGRPLSAAPESSR